MSMNWRDRKIFPSLLTRAAEISTIYLSRIGVWPYREVELIEDLGNRWRFLFLGALIR